MTLYYPLLELNVNHTYFSGGRCNYLKFIPTDNSVYLMNNAGLLYKSYYYGLTINADKNNIDTLKLFAKDIDNPFELQFKVYCTDPNFINYTYPNPFNEGGMLYFQQIMDGNSQGNENIIHSGAWVSENDIASTRFLNEKGLINSRDKIDPPCFIFSVVITEKAIIDFAKEQFVASRFHIKFQAKSNIWKYYLMTDESNHQVRIVDIGDEIIFESLGIEDLGMNKHAMTFQSETALSMYEKSHYHFQLMSKKENSSQVLINRLPVAKVSQGNQKVINGKAVSLSEIYINF